MNNWSSKLHPPSPQTLSIPQPPSSPPLPLPQMFHTVPFRATKGSHFAMLCTSVPGTYVLSSKIFYKKRWGAQVKAVPVPFSIVRGSVQRSKVQPSVASTEQWSKVQASTQPYATNADLWHSYQCNEEHWSATMQCKASIGELWDGGGGWGGGGKAGGGVRQQTGRPLGRRPSSPPSPSPPHPSRSLVEQKPGMKNDTVIMWLAGGGEGRWWGNFSLIAY